MPQHHFKATPVKGTPAAEALLNHIRKGQADVEGAAQPNQDVQLSFERYYGIGTFPVETSDELYRDEIISACQQKFGFDLSPYYYPTAANGETTERPQLFYVTDQTAQQHHQHRQRFKRDMNQLNYSNRHSHSSYFYIFIRPIQIMLIAGLIGYALYLSYKNELRMADEQEEQMMDQRRQYNDEDY